MDTFLDIFERLIFEFLKEDAFKIGEFFLRQDVDLRINPSGEASKCFGIDFITIEFESWDDECGPLTDIPTLSGDIPLGIVYIRHECRLSFTENGCSRTGSGWWDLYPIARFEHNTVISHETSIGTENLLLSELIVDLDRPVGILGAHLIDGRHIERIIQWNFQCHLMNTDGIFAIQNARLFLLRKDDITRYGLHSEFRSNRDVRLGYREVEDK